MRVRIQAADVRLEQPIQDIPGALEVTTVFEIVDVEDDVRVEI